MDRFQTLPAAELSNQRVFCSGYTNPWQYMPYDNCRECNKGCEEKGSSGTVVWMSFQSLSKIVYPGLARLARLARAFQY